MKAWGANKEAQVNKGQTNTKCMQMTACQGYVWEELDVTQMEMSVLVSHSMQTSWVLSVDWILQGLWCEFTFSVHTEKEWIGVVWFLGPTVKKLWGKTRSTDRLVKTQNCSGLTRLMKDIWGWWGWRNNNNTAQIYTQAHTCTHTYRAPNDWHCSYFKKHA